MVAGIDQDDKKKIILQASGRCGLNRLIEALKDDQAQFAAFRVYAVDAGVKQPKFVYFTWTGPNCNLKTKVAATQIKSSVYKAFEVSFFPQVHIVTFRKVSRNQSRRIL